MMCYKYSPKSYNIIFTFSFIHHKFKIEMRKEERDAFYTHIHAYALLCLNEVKGNNDDNNN